MEEEYIILDQAVSYNEREDRDLSSKDQLIEKYWDDATNTDLGYETNQDGSKMSHLTVQVDKDGYPIGIKSKGQEKWMYVDE